MDELFDTFDDQGIPRGLAARHRVHSLGLWHKSAHVFLFDRSGNIYLQLRAPDKDLYPSLWDYSVGDNLQPGESFRAAAARGLHEELGIGDVVLQTVGGVRASKFDNDELRVHDHELQQGFRGVYSGPMHPDPIEVAEVRSMEMLELETWIGRSPDSFTPWFLRDLRELGFLPGESVS